jgi:hypothetical protein
VIPGWVNRGASVLGSLALCVVGWWVGWFVVAVPWTRAGFAGIFIGSCMAIAAVWGTVRAQRHTLAVGIAVGAGLSLIYTTLLSLAPSV